MTILVDASSKFTADLTNAQPTAFTGPSIAAPLNSRVVVCASCSAASGHPLSDINITDSAGHTWTLHQKLRQANGGKNSPIGIWSTVANGNAFTVTQTATDSGFSMAQAVWVLTGAGAVITSGTFIGTTAASITQNATAAGQLALFGMNDWQNNTDTPAHANASMTDRLIVPGTVNHQAAYFGDLFSAASGNFAIGTNALGSPQGTNGVAILVAAQTSTTVNGTAVIVLPGVTAKATKTIVTDGSWYTLVAIERERHETARRLHSSPPVACPNDGEPLRTTSRGTRRCPFDGWEWPTDGPGIR